MKIGKLGENAHKNRQSGVKKMIKIVTNDHNTQVLVVVCNNPVFVLIQLFNSFLHYNRIIGIGHKMGIPMHEVIIRARARARAIYMWPWPWPS